MTAIDQGSPHVRRGGLEVWEPSVVPPIGVDLSDEQKLACAFRILARTGFAENIAGHITWQRPGEEDLLVNPWGLWWREMCGSDICKVDENGRRGGGHAGTSRPPSTSIPNCTGRGPTPEW